MNEPQDIRPVYKSEGDFNPLGLLRIFVCNLRWIIGITVAAAILSAMYSMRLPNIYTAKATVLLPQKDSGGGASTLIASMGGGAANLLGGIGGSADLYIGLLKSRTLTDSVLKRLDPNTDFKSKEIDSIRGALQGSAKFQAGKDGIITVSVDYEDPVKAAMLANAFVEELQKKSVQLNLSKATTDRSFLEKQLVAVRQDLQKAEDDLKAYQEKIPSTGVELYRLQRKLKTQEALFEQLTKQLEVAKMNEARDSSSLQVLDEAVKPKQSSKPNRITIVIFSTVVAFFCSLLLVFTRESFANLSPENEAIMDDIKRMLRLQGSKK